ncbi:MAG: NADH-quinone oxidoreductase subunit N [Ilumatobacteraceae bacterium]
MGTDILDVMESPALDWFGLSPLLVLLGVALVMLVVGALTPAWPRHLATAITSASGVAVGVLGVLLWQQVDREGASLLVNEAVYLDKTTVWAMIVAAVGIVMVSFTSDGYDEREGLAQPETHALYLLAALGAIVMAGANSLIVLFLALETMSLALYVLVASHRRRTASQESGLKYFVLGGFSSAVFLYGVALVYGGTGSTEIARMLVALDRQVDLDPMNETMMLAGVALIIVGLAFKVGAVPFHSWVADVYQGAPTPVTSFMASVAKAAAFVAMLRVLLTGLGHWADDYRPVVAALAVITLAVGSVMAVVQTDVKRMLAFSSVSHAGFMLVGVEAAAHVPGTLESDGASAVLLYVLVYAVLVLGTFAVVTAVSGRGDAATTLDAFRGLGRSRPVLALGMTVLLLAQAGVPLTSGFVAKFGVISAAAGEQSYLLAVLAMVSAVIAAYLYLRIMISMWVADPAAGDDARDPVQVSRPLAAVVAMSVAFTLFVGVLPGPLVGITP